MSPGPKSGLGGSGPAGMIIRTMIASVIGGTGARLGGGKFANGAVSAAFVHLFNAEGLASRGLNWTKDNISRILTTVGGGAQVVAGGLMCTMGIGCVAGAALIAHGANNLYEGISGNDGALRQGYQALLGKDAGNIAYGVVDVGTSVTGLVKAVAKPGTWKLFKNIPSDYVRGYQATSAPALTGEIAVDVNTISDTYHRVQ